jgi:membrane fusion protein (multidrug efflux system)
MNNPDPTPSLSSEPSIPSLRVLGKTFSRTALLWALTVVLAMGGASFAGYHHLHASAYESTEDAYVGGNQVQLMPQVAGAVLTIYADDTDLVHAGQTLVKLDPTDRQIALEQTQAALAQAVRDVRVVLATRAQLQAEVRLRQAQLASAAADVGRREDLTARGLVPREELEHARDAVTTASAAVQAAQETLAATQARVDGTRIDNHPSVQQAATRVKEAYLALQRTTLRAPVSGYVAKRAVQVGQRVEPGMPLLAIVPLDDLWVDANFKEVQLREMRIGQPAQVTADLYGQQVQFAGEVVGVGIGTGAAFALLPAQNASGNWIKIVQRVPVRIRLKSEELRTHPLRIGLSIKVRVDLSLDGPQLASAPRTSPAYETSVYAPDAIAADELIHEIVASNSGGKVKPSRHSAEAGLAAKLPLTP